MDSPEDRFTGVYLMQDEYTDSTLNLAGNSPSLVKSNRNAVILTNRRVIVIQSNSQLQTTFVSLSDVHSIEIQKQKEGPSAFVWASLAFICALFLYMAIDTVVLRVLSSVSVAALGIYLIGERLLLARPVSLIFRTGSTELGCDIQNIYYNQHILYSFINKVFELKAKATSSETYLGNYAPH